MPISLIPQTLYNVFDFFFAYLPIFIYEVYSHVNMYSIQILNITEEINNKPISKKVKNYDK